MKLDNFALKRVITGIAFAVMLTGAAAAGTRYDDGWAAYERGDHVEAVKHWRACATDGDMWCQYNLGISYLEGQGVPQDYAEAVLWWHLAAVQGHASSQSNIGVSYERGLGVPQDYAEAVLWYRLAAEQGDAEAKHNLGLMYATGEGVTQNFVLAHMWFNLAAAQGVEGSIKGRDMAAERMTSDQITEAQRLAREWKPKASQ